MAKQTSEPILPLGYERFQVNPYNEIFLIFLLFRLMSIVSLVFFKGNQQIVELEARGHDRIYPASQKTGMYPQSYHMHRAASGRGTQTMLLGRLWRCPQGEAVCRSGVLTGVP